MTDTEKGDRMIETNATRADGSSAPACWLSRWSTIFTIVMFAEAILSLFEPLMMSNALIFALLANKFREDEKNKEVDRDE